MKREIVSDEDLQDFPPEWDAPNTEPERTRVRCYSDIPFLRDISGKKTEYMREPELPTGAVVALTGESGHGKSTLALAWARDAQLAGYPVLILDRENPFGVIESRYDALSMADGPSLRHWGGWVGEDAPEPAAPIVVEWVQSCTPKPLVIVDSLAAFLCADENDASKMRAFMNQARKLANLGATVVLIHNSGKADTAKEYRGSSDFKASLDVGFTVSNLSGTDGRLNKLTLKCFKSRFGFHEELVYHYAGGKLMRDRDEHAVARTNAEKLNELLLSNPGIITTDFESKAKELGVARSGARNFLEVGVKSGEILIEPGPGRTKRHSLRSQ